MRRIMYIENKAGGLDGHGRIGWVELSKSRRTYFYRGRELTKVGSGYKYNFVDAENGDHYWISGPHKNGADKLYGGVVTIDEDARVEYWTKIRELPERVEQSKYRAGGNTRTGGKWQRNEKRARGASRS
ncbi:MAG: 1-deoxy-D-xylulose-5-phosphate synthase [Polyangiaceae bacterium]